MERVIHFRQAVSLLGRFPALAGVDLDVATGEIVLVQGPNGAGKTTLLRSCAGLVPIVDGTAEVLGLDLRADGRSVRHRVGLLGHTTGLYADLTVADNVRFWARAARARPVDAEASMERLGLTGRLAGVAVERLSAGQRRRTALACLVARRPELWLLDEPHAGLDAAGRDILDGIVRDAAAAGATVLVASHELERASVLAHRQVVINGGMVTADEPLTSDVPLSGGEPNAADASTGGSVEPDEPTVADEAVHGRPPGAAVSPTARSGEGPASVPLAVTGAS